MADLITDPQKAKLRGDGQFALVYLGGDIGAPVVIFAARVNQTFLTTDMVAQLTYDTVTTGAYGSVLADMTMLVGSSAGLSDVGICRVRKAPTSTILYVNESSEIAWADNLYLTVIEDFDLWRKDLKIVNKVTYMDFDVAYSNQHASCDPVPVFGQDVCIFRPDITIDGSHPVTITAFNASPSWVIGSTITARSFSVTPSTGVTITNGTTNTPSIDLTAAGKYRVSCLLTAANGKTFMGHRYIYAYDATHLPLKAFVIETPTGSQDAGGWSFRLRMFAEAVDIRPRAKVFLIARDFYGGVEGGIGLQAGRENIEVVGHIGEEEDITIDPEQGDVTFDVRGPQYWFAQIPCFPTGVRNTNSTAAAWTEIQNLTVDKGLWHLLHWQTTATRMMDVILSGDTRILSESSAPASNMWAQMTELATATILAKPLCDHYGALWVQIDTQFVPAASRSSIPVVMTLTKADLARQYQLTRRIVAKASQNNMSGVIVTNGLIGSAVFSLANGHVPKRYGSPEVHDRLLLSSQAQANELASSILEQANNPYADIPLKLAANNRAFDIAPLQFASMDISSADNVRGLAYSGHLIPRQVSYEHDPQTGNAIPSIDFEAETFPNSLAVNGDAAPTPLPTSAPLISFPSPLPYVPFPIDWPPMPKGPPFAVVLNNPHGVYYADLSNPSPTWISMNTTLPSPQYIEDMQIGPDGTIYVSYGVSILNVASNPVQGIWSAKIGDLFVRICDDDSWRSFWPATTANIIIRAMGIDPYRNDRIAVHLRLDAGPSGGHYMAYGTPSALVKGYATPYSFTSTFGFQTVDSLTMGDGAWVLTANLGTNGLRAFSQDCKTLLRADACTLTQRNYHVRAGKSGLLYQTTAPGFTRDNGLTIPLDISRGTLVNFIVPKDSIACDPTGQFLMARYYGPGAVDALMRSTDFGVTWGTIPALDTINSNHKNVVFCNLGDSDRWLAAGDYGIFMTDDFGDTWTNYLGDLGSYVTIPGSFTSIKAVWAA